MRILRATVVALALIAMTASAVVAQRLQPLVVDWQQYFRVESELSTRDGRPQLKGTPGLRYSHSCTGSITRGRIG